MTDYGYKIKLLIFIIVLLSQTLAQNGAYSNTWNLDNSMTVKARLPTTSTIEFEITAPSTGWCGFGFGTSMTNTDMFIIESTGSGVTFTDRYSTGQSAPGSDTTSDITGSTSTSGSTNTYTISRNLNTGDSQDYMISDGSHNMIYSYGSSTSMGYHGVSNYGAITLTTDSSTRTTSISSGSVSIDTDNATIHGLLLYFAWGVLGFVLVISGRYFKYFYLFRIYLHAMIGIIVLILSIIAVGGYGESGRTRKSANSFGDEHTSVGGLVITWTIVSSSLGLIAKGIQKFVKYKTLFAKYSRWVHIWVSYLLLAYSHIAFLSGMYYFDSPYTYLYYIHLAVIFLLHLTIEVIFQLKSKWKYDDLKTLEQKDFKEITIEEFQQCIKEGKKYALFDNYVLDVTWYSFDHPGSSYLIDANVGKDVGKYFVGSYSMENKAPAYTHSLIAGKILKKLVCAKIKDSDQTVIVPREEPNESVISGTHINPDAILARSNSNIFYVEGKDELMRDVYRFRLGNKSSLIKGFYSGLELSGRGYVLSSLQNHVCRYYTLCNCMSSKFYKQYLDAFKNILQGDVEGYKPLEYQQVLAEKDDYMEIVIKHYHQTKKGISTQLTYASAGDQFYVNAPVGKGHDIDFNSLKGTYMLFVGGTGILPYMDLFAYMVRNVIAKNSPNNCILSGEKFDHDMSDVHLILYTYNQNEQNAVGYDFVSQMAEVYKHFGIENQFTLVPKFTRQGDKRLDKEAMFEILTNQKNSSGLDKIWVCGPPPMNNLFYRYIKEISKKVGIDTLNIDIF